MCVPRQPSGLHAAIDITTLHVPAMQSGELPPNMLPRHNDGHGLLDGERALPSWFECGFTGGCRAAAQR